MIILIINFQCVDKVIDVQFLRNRWFLSTNPFTIKNGTNNSEFQSQHKK